MTNYCFVFKLLIAYSSKLIDVYVVVITGRVGDELLNGHCCPHFYFEVSLTCYLATWLNCNNTLAGLNSTSNKYSTAAVVSSIPGINMSALSAVCDECNFFMWKCTVIII